MKIVQVENEYKKTTDLKKDEVLKILQWAQQQPHLPELCEREIILFYFSCYYSVELTKRTIDCYYTLRTHCTDFFSKMDVLSPEMKMMMNTLSVVPIRNKCTPEGYKIFISRLDDSNINNFDFSNCIKLYCMTMELTLLQDGIQEGHVLVMDMSNVTLSHVTRLNPMGMKRFLTFLQDAAPLRLKSLHYINIVPFMDKFMALIKPFMKQELLEMLYLHSSLEDFYKFVPKDILPEDFGGSNGNLKSYKDEICKELIENRDYFLNEEKTRRVNEKLRTGKAEHSLDLFGAEGNFKKLNFD